MGWWGGIYNGFFREDKIKRYSQIFRDPFLGFLLIWCSPPHVSLSSLSLFLFFSYILSLYINECTSISPTCTYTESVSAYLLPALKRSSLQLIFSLSFFPLFPFNNIFHSLLPLCEVIRSICFHHFWEYVFDSLVFRILQIWPKSSSSFPKLFFFFPSFKN